MKGIEITFKDKTRVVFPHFNHNMMFELFEWIIANEFVMIEGDIFRSKDIKRVLKLK